MSSPLYTPISFVSPISEPSRSSPHSPTSSTHDDSTNTNNTHKPSHIRRLSTYLKHAFTLEDPQSARRRESIISDAGAAHQETERRASIVSYQDERDEEALLARRRGSIEGFWRKYGKNGRRSSAVNEEGERAAGRRKSSTGLGLELGLGGRWIGRKMSWAGRRGSE